MTQDEKNKIIELRVSGKGYGRIAAELNLSKNTVASFLKRNEANNINKIKDGNCQNCGIAIKLLPKRRQKKFCSDSCRMKWWNSNLDNVNKKAFYILECKNCKKILKIYGNKERKFCCVNCYNAYRTKVGGSND